MNGRHELGWAPLHIAAVNCRREVGRMRIPGTYTNTTFGLYFFFRIFAYLLNAAKYGAKKDNTKNLRKITFYKN